MWLSFAGRVFSLHGAYYLVVCFCFVGLLGGLVDHNEYELDIERFVEAAKEFFFSVFSFYGISMSFLRCSIEEVFLALRLFLEI